MSITLMSLVWHANFPPTDKLVALALADNANDSGVCWPSITNICKKTSLSERCVQGAIKRLEKVGFVKREIRDGRSTVYNIIPPQQMRPAPDAPQQDVHPTPAPDAPPPPHVVHPEPSLEPSREPPRVRKARRKENSLDDLSVDHIRDWLAKKRTEGRYLEHDEHFILEYFKNYCTSNNKKYDDYTAAYRNAFEWDRCQPKAKSGTAKHPAKSNWTSEGDRLAAKYREKAQSERDGAIGTGA